MGKTSGAEGEGGKHTHSLALGGSRSPRQRPHRDTASGSCDLTTPALQPVVKGKAGQMLMDLSHIKKSRRAEGQREGERGVKQLSGSKVHWPFPSARGRLGALGSALSVIRTPSLRNLLCQLCSRTRGPEERIDGQLHGCSFCSPGEAVPKQIS